MHSAVLLHHSISRVSERRVMTLTAMPEHVVPQQGGAAGSVGEGLVSTLTWPCQHAHTSAKIYHKFCRKLIRPRAYRILTRQRRHGDMPAAASHRTDGLMTSQGSKASTTNRQGRGSSGDLWTVRPGGSKQLLLTALDALNGQAHAAGRTWTHQLRAVVRGT